MMQEFTVRQVICYNYVNEKKEGQNVSYEFKDLFCTSLLIVVMNVKKNVLYDWYENVVDRMDEKYRGEIDRTFVKKRIAGI